MPPGLTATARGRERAAQISRLGIGRHLSERRLSELADTVTPQGILVVAQIPEAGLAELVLPIDPRLLVLDGVQRSEERRVGKECASRCWTEYYVKERAGFITCQDCVRNK